jgi:hypothetical protein
VGDWGGTIWSIKKEIIRKSKCLTTVIGKLYYASTKVTFQIPLSLFTTLALFQYLLKLLYLIILQMNIVCDDAIKTSHVGMLYFAGVFTGSLLLGAFSDAYVN